MNILPNLKSTTRLLHHSRLIQTIIALPTSAARTLSDRSFLGFRPFEDRAFFKKESTVVETHAWEAGDEDSHPGVAAEGRVVEGWNTHCVCCVESR